MIYSKIALLGALTALSSLVAAHPLTDATLENLFKRAVSPDNTCGNLYAGANNGYTCDTTTAGPCCSQYVCLTFLGFQAGVLDDWFVNNATVY